MLCDIYTTNKHGVALFVKAKTRPTEVLPTQAQIQLGPLSHHGTQEVSYKTLLIGADESRTMLANIELDGYHIQGFTKSVTEGNT